MTLCALFLRYKIIRSSWTYLIIFFLSLKQLWSDTFHDYQNVFLIQQLFLLFLRTITLFRCSKVHRLTLILPIIGFMKLACRFGHSKEKMDLYGSLCHQEYWQYQKYLLKLSGDYQLSKCSKFRFFVGTTVYWKSKSSSNFTRNKSLELVLEQNAKALSTLYLGFLILMCSFIYWKSSELIDRRYDSRHTVKKFCYKCFKCLLLATSF